MPLSIPHPPGERNDRELVLSARKGDERAFTNLVLRHQPIVYRICARIVGESNARDATQVAFVKSYRYLKKLKNPEHYRAWVIRIARNHCLSFLKKHRREYLQDEFEETPSAASEDIVAAISTQRRSQRLRKAVEELPEKQKAVVELRVYEDLSYEEISTALEISANSARVNFHHAIRFLRERLESNE